MTKCCICNENLNLKSGILNLKFEIRNLKSIRARQEYLMVDG